MAKIRIIDSHCHLGHELPARHNSPAPAPTLSETLAKARAQGVEAVVDVGIDVDSSRRCLERARSHDMIWASAGLHPNSCTEYETQIASIAELAKDEACVAIGESGLDSYWDRVPSKTQIASLEAHLALAKDLDKAIILHCREAFVPLFETLAAQAPVHGVLHCFTGGIAEAQRCLDLGLYVSFAGPLTYPRNEDLRRAARYLPADRILVETDAPFLPPQSMRGQRNEPWAVREVLETLASIRSVSLAQMAASCTANSHAHFGVAEERAPDPRSRDGRESVG